MTAIQYPIVGAMTFDAIVTKVHDGDTVTLDIDLAKYVSGADRSFGFHIYVEGRRLHFHNATRLYGINAPELATPDGQKSQQALAATLPIGTLVKLSTWLDQSDKYGRTLGRIFTTSIDFNQWMVDNGFAFIYYGVGPKPVGP